MNLTLLGTAGAIPFKDRDTSTLSVETDSGLFLVDCGGSMVSRMNSCGLPWRKVQGVFFTHRHIDHINGFPHLVQVYYLEGRTDPLSVYGPSETIVLLREWVRLFGFDRKDLGYELTFRKLRLEGESHIIDSGDLRVDAIPVCHGIPAVGYRFHHRLTGADFTYTGDTGPSRSISEFARKTQLLICEASLVMTPMAGPPFFHSTVTDAACLARNAEARQLCLTHFGSDPSPFEAAINQAVRELYNGQLILGVDYLRLVHDTRAGVFTPCPPFSVGEISN